MIAPISSIQKYLKQILCQFTVSMANCYLRLPAVYVYVYIKHASCIVSGCENWNLIPFLIKFVFAIISKVSNSLILFVDYFWNQSDLGTICYKMKHFCNLCEKYICKSATEWRVPGMAVAMVKDNRVIYARGFGVKKLGSGAKVDEKTVFQIGSISKSFTSALVSSLVDEGKFSWKDKIKHCLPHFRLHDSAATAAFTIADLMSQCSGLPPHSGRLLPFLGYDRDYIINAIRYIKPTGNFGVDYAYQNNLFLVAADLIERYTGKSWCQNLSRRILNPLEMKATTTNYECYRNSGNVALGHYYSNSEVDGPVTPIPLNWPYYYWLDTYAPAGGINSNIIDMAKWLILQINRGSYNGKQVISPENITFMHTPKTPAGEGIWGEPRHYCQGWIHAAYRPFPIIWHNGGTSGMKSIAAIVPQAQIGIIVLCNLYESFLPEAVCRYMLDLWFGNPPLDWSRKFLQSEKCKVQGISTPPTPYIPSRPLYLYTGAYNNNLYGRATVSKTGRSLLMNLGTKNVRLKLKHWGGDTFVLYWPGVLTHGSCVHFFFGRSGMAKAVRIEGMNDDLTGVFTKIGQKFDPDWLKNWV